jgi:NTE family protein
MTPPIEHPQHPRRALVLGGGGVVGRAWQIGLAAGFLDHGIDLSEADLIIGTSAGAVTGAQLALGVDPRAAVPAVDAIYANVPDASAGLLRLAAEIANTVKSAAPEVGWKAIGEQAIAAPTMSEDAYLAREVFAAFTGRGWPRNFVATTVNARTGQFRAWDWISQAPLERGVAASTALPGTWPPISIGDDRYIDAGVRSFLNADLASGAASVLVISCLDLAIPAGAPEALRIINGAHQAEIEALRASGSEVEALSPNRAFLELTGYGTRMLDGSLPPQAYEVGKAQAASELERARRLY